jgi:hypothetical protein
MAVKTTPHSPTTPTQTVTAGQAAARGAATGPTTAGTEELISEDIG